MRALLLALLVGFGLRVYHLAAQDLWGDEAFTTYVVALPTARVLAPGTDTHPPLYYALLKPWVSLTRLTQTQPVQPDVSVRRAQAFSLRFPSAAFSLLSIPLAYLAGVWLMSRRAGLLAAWLLATAPVMVYYGQELRMYALAVTLSLASAVCLIRLLRHGSQVRWWVAYGVTTLLGMYTHYGVFFVLPAHALAVGIALRTPPPGRETPPPTPPPHGGGEGREASRIAPPLHESGEGREASRIAPPLHEGGEGREASRIAPPPGGGGVGEGSPLHRPVLLWLGVMAVLAMAYLPWTIGQARSLLGHTRAESSRAWRVADLVDIGWQGLVSFTAGLTLPWGNGLAVTLGVGLAGLGVVALLRKGVTWGAVLLASGVIFPLLVGWLVNPIMPFFHARFVLMGAAPLLIAAALGVDRLWRTWRWFGALALGAILTLNGVSLYHWYVNPAYIKTDYGQAMAGLAQRARRDDLILLNNQEQTALYELYGLGEVTAEVLDNDEVLTPQRTDRTLSRAVQARSRVWLVNYGDPAVYDPQHHVEQWLGQRGFRAYYQSHRGFDVSLYLLPGNTATTPTQALNVTFGDGIRLRGADVQPQPVQPGQALLVTLFWQPTATPQGRYTVFTHLVDAQGRLVAQFDGEPAGGAQPTDSWRPGETVVDRRALTIQADTPPGKYQVRVGLYSFPSLERLRVVEALGPAPDNAVIVTTVGVEP